MSEQSEPDPEALAQGWRRQLEAAVEAAMEDVPVDEVREIDVIYARKKNPIHEYRVTLRPR
jgi:hypothetical protein